MIQDKALIPVHAVASKSAQRLYLSTFLFAVASLFLLASSSVAYAIFYYHYVPQIGVERSIHLQFGCVPTSPVVTAREFMFYD